MKKKLSILCVYQRSSLIVHFYSLVCHCYKRTSQFIVFLLVALYVLFHWLGCICLYNLCALWTMILFGINVKASACLTISRYVSKLSTLQYCISTDCNVSLSPPKKSLFACTTCKMYLENLLYL